MKVFEVYGVFKTWIREIEVSSMDDEFVYNSKGLKSSRYTREHAYEITYKEALIKAMQMTDFKIKELKKQLLDYTNEAIEAYSGETS